MPKITEIKFAGRDIKVAPPPFSEDVCDLVELFEKAAAVNKANAGRSDENKEAFGENGRMLKLLRRVAIDCFVRGGHTADEAVEILNSVSMDVEAEDSIPALAAALGLL